MRSRVVSSILLASLICCLSGCIRKTFQYQRPYRSMEDLPVEGTWIVTDEANNTFNIIFRKNGTAISSWARGVSGAYGDRGRWKYSDDGVFTMYESGWMTLLAQLDNGFLVKLAYAPGRLITQPPSNFCMAIPLVGPARRYVGIFRCVAPDTKEPYYIALISSGLAIKTFGKEMSGTWHLNNGKAVIEWANGWTDIMDYSGGVYRQSVFSPGIDIKKSEPMATTIVGTADGRPYGN